VYQPAQSVPAAVRELLRGAGSQFDSAVVAAFVATVERRAPREQMPLAPAY
jgi:HD-GYP domain-containing protein (c-di-GMP phosphodiesterase class II)